MPSLWITYAWTDNTDGDFDYLVQRLSEHGVSAKFDRIALIPGQRLWEQIAQKICSYELSGWAYLLTPKSIASAPCKEELAYALHWALSHKAETFPLIGLMHNVAIDDVPMPLRVRLCVDLANADWIEEVRAAVEVRPPMRNPTQHSPHIMKRHLIYSGNANRTAIEVRPRFGELRNWRLGFPKSGLQPVSWGIGAANGGGIDFAQFSIIEGEQSYKNGMTMRIYGGGAAISSSTSAYAVFESALPTLVSFGVSNAADTLPKTAELFETAKIPLAGRVV